MVKISECEVRLTLGSEAYGIAHVPRYCSFCGANESEHSHTVHSPDCPLVRSFDAQKALSQWPPAAPIARQALCRCGADIDKGERHAYWCLNRCSGEDFSGCKRSGDGLPHYHLLKERHALLATNYPFDVVVSMTDDETQEAYAKVSNPLFKVTVSSNSEPEVDLAASVINETLVATVAHERKAFHAFLVDRALELREEASKTNLFEGRRAELVCAIREIDRLTKDFAAKFAALQNDQSERS